MSKLSNINNMPFPANVSTKWANDFGYDVDESGHLSDKITYHEPILDPYFNEEE